ADLVGPNHVLLGPMSTSELRRTIEGPSGRVGLEVEPELVDTLVDDVAGEPGGLPLLSTALVDLWEARDGRRLTLAAYARSGGVRGAVARHAEAAFRSLDAGDQLVARRGLPRAGGRRGVAGIWPRGRWALSRRTPGGGSRMGRIRGGRHAEPSRARFPAGESTLVRTRQPPAPDASRRRARAAHRRAGSRRGCARSAKFGGSAGDISDRREARRASADSATARPLAPPRAGGGQHRRLPCDPRLSAGGAPARAGCDRSRARGRRARVRRGAQSQRPDARGPG